MPHYQRHVFVCVNERAETNPKGCCKQKDGQIVRDQLKKRLIDRGINKIVRANNSGCLDQCEYGVTVVVYPEQVWYGGVTVDDLDEIIERHIIGGEYVERLMIPDQAHLGDEMSSAPLDVPTAAPSPDDASAEG